jgi:hypothetical protein
MLDDIDPLLDTIPRPPQSGFDLDLHVDESGDPAATALAHVAQRQPKADHLWNRRANYAASCAIGASASNFRSWSACRMNACPRVSLQAAAAPAAAAA